MVCREFPALTCRTYWRVGTRPALFAALGSSFTVFLGDTSNLKDAVPRGSVTQRKEVALRVGRGVAHPAPFYAERTPAATLEGAVPRLWLADFLITARRPFMNEWRLLLLVATFRSTPKVTHACIHPSTTVSHSRIQAPSWERGSHCRFFEQGENTAPDWSRRVHKQTSSRVAFIARSQIRFEYKSMWYESLKTVLGKA